MKNILFIILLIGFIGFSQDQGELQFENNVIDFGEISEGSTARKSLTFKNIGQQPVQIKKVSSTGHVTVEKHPQKVSPQSESQIIISYNTNKLGPIRRTLTVYSNAKNSFVSIKIKGKVVKQN